MGKTICFTGKRPKGMYGYTFNEKYKKMEWALYDWLRARADINRAITGGTQGFDQVAFWACNEANISKNGLYIPFHGQESKWRRNGLFGQKEYYRIILNADEMTVCSKLDIETASAKELAEAYLKRNRDMVDNSDIVFGCFDTSIDFHKDRSGTAATLRYAEEQGKEIWFIDVNSMEVKRYE